MPRRTAASSCHPPRASPRARGETRPAIVCARRPGGEGAARSLASAARATEQRPACGDREVKARRDRSLALRRRAASAPSRAGRPRAARTCRGPVVRLRRVLIEHAPADEGGAPAVSCSVRYTYHRLCAALAAGKARVARGGPNTTAVCIPAEERAANGRAHRVALDVDRGGGRAAAVCVAPLIRSLIPRSLCTLLPPSPRHRARHNNECIY